MTTRKSHFLTLQWEIPFVHIVFSIFWCNFTVAVMCPYQRAGALSFRAVSVENGKATPTNQTWKGSGESVHCFRWVSETGQKERMTMMMAWPFEITVKTKPYAGYYLLSFTGEISAETRLSVGCAQDEMHKMKMRNEPKVTGAKSVHPHVRNRSGIELNRRFDWIHTSALCGRRQFNKFSKE